MRRPMRFAVFALLMLCWGVSLVTTQLPVTRPAISEEISPVEEFSVEAQDGPRAVGVLRRPPGPGPFPAVVIAYPVPLSQWKTMALTNQTMTRFLAAGYVTVMHAPRPRQADLPRDPQASAAVASMLATVKHVKQMPAVDPKSVVLYGCSAMGGLALEVAGATEVAAVTAEEPGAFWIMPLMPTLASGDEFIQAMEDPHRFFTPAVREAIREKFRPISGPIFIAQGDQPIGGRYSPHKTFDEILIPDLKAAGKDVEDITYSGQKHCFGFFATADRGVANDGDAAARRFFADMDAFFKRHLPTQPVAVDDSLVEHVPIEAVPVSSDTVRESVAITVSSEILADYVGTYEAIVETPGPKEFVVTLEDNQLIVEIAGLGKSPLFAASETDFIIRGRGLEIEFVRGEDGRVTDLIVRPFNRTFSKQEGR